MHCHTKCRCNRLPPYDCSLFRHLFGDRFQSQLGVNIDARPWILRHKLSLEIVVLLVFSHTHGGGDCTCSELPIAISRVKPIINTCCAISGADTWKSTWKSRGILLLSYIWMQVHSQITRQNNSINLLACNANSHCHLHYSIMSRSKQKNKIIMHAHNTREMNILIIGYCSQPLLQLFVKNDLKRIINVDGYESNWFLKPCSQPHARFFDRTFFSLIPIFWNRIRFY